MKRHILFGTLALLAGSLLAANAAPKDDVKVQGKVSFNGNDRDVDRTTTVEIKDIGSTKVQVPDDAKKKL